MAGLEPDVARKSQGGKKNLGPYKHPDPQVMARDVEPGDPALPAPLISTRKLAVANGWDVLTRYARGFVYVPPGKTGKLIHSFSIRISRDNYRAAAVWVAPVEELPLKWSFDYAGMMGVSCWGSTPEGFAKFGKQPFTLNSNEFKGLIKTTDRHHFPILDPQYERLEGEAKDEWLMPWEPYRKMLYTPPPKKEKGAMGGVPIAGYVVDEIDAIKELVKEL